MIREPETIDQDNFSEPTGINLDRKKDVHNYLRNIIHSFLSKEGVFTNFTEGREALSRTPDGYKVLNILLSQTHPKMLDVWACEKQKPLYSEYNDLNKYCKAIQNHIELEKSSGRKYYEIEITRMFLSNLNSPRLTPIAHALKQELRGLSYNENNITPNLKLMMLPGTITNHHLYSGSPIPSSNSNTIQDQSAQANTLSNAHNPSEDDTFIVNAFRNFYASGQGMRNNRNQSSNPVCYNRSRTSQPFRGKCNACGQANHHAKDCNFLHKLNTCLNYMEKNNFTPTHLRKFYRQTNNYNKYATKSNVARTLQEENFIPYDNVDPDAFINVLDEDATYQLLDTDEE